MKKFISIAISIILILGTASFTAAFETAATVPSGIPISELEQFTDKFMAKYIGTKTAGASIAITKDGQMVFNKAYGYAIQDKLTISPDSVFEWGSAAKLLVWTSAMQLAEQGKLNLNRDIREYLPENFLKKLKYETPITFYNLMHHNAGWEDRMVDIFYHSPNAIPSLEGALLAWEPVQVFRPGTVVAYSNFGAALAGYIIERISGQPFHQYVWKNIFEPLGMKDTSIHPLQSDNPSVAERRKQIMGHKTVKGKPVPSKNERNYVGLYPAGSTIGTVQDAVKFLSALMPGSETSILFRDNKTLDEMLQVSLFMGDGFPRIAHGFMECFGSVRVLGHGGNTAAFSSHFAIAPKEHFGIVIMTNQAEETLFPGLTKALFGEHIPPVNTAEYTDANKLAGTYIMARRPYSGFTKFFMSVLVFRVKAIDENTLDLAGAVFVQKSPHVFKNTGGSELLDMIDYISFETENNSVSHISSAFFDLLPLGTGSLIINYGSAVLFALCIVYIPSALIISITGAVKNRKKGIPSNLAKKLNIALYASMAAAIFNNVILTARALSFSAYSSLRIHFIVTIIYAVFAPICAGLLWVNRKKEPSKRSVVFNTFSIVCSVILAVFLITWEFWH